MVNASQLQFKLGDAEGGAQTCYQLYKLFPKSSNGRDCLTQAAQTFEAMARLDLAARVLLNLALVEVEKQDFWRETAADFFALSGAKSRAIQMYIKLSDTKKVPEQIKLLEKARIVAKESADTVSLKQIDDELIRMHVEPYVTTVMVEQAEAALTESDPTRAFNLSKKLIAKDGSPKDLAARARFVQAKVLADEYRKQSVKARVEKIGMVLAIKTEKLEKAQKAMQSTINYGDNVTSVRALQQLAGLYLDYATTIRSMNLPAGTSASDAKAFKAEIEQLTIPMEEKGIEAMALALETAKKAQLRDGQINELQVAVDRLNMKTDAMPKADVSKPEIYIPKFRAASEKSLYRTVSMGAR